jgi:DNA polymerase III delta subunit
MGVKKKAKKIRETKLYLPNTSLTDKCLFFEKRKIRKRKKKRNFLTVKTFDY